MLPAEDQQMESPAKIKKVTFVERASDSSSHVVEQSLPTRLNQERVVVVGDSIAQHFDMTIDDSDGDNDIEDCIVTENRVAKRKPAGPHGEAPDTKRYRIIGKRPG